jgi:poly(3-hydroxybutyrate) depolymerase
MHIPQFKVVAACAFATMALACSEPDSAGGAELDSATAPGTVGFGDAGPGLGSDATSPGSGQLIGGGVGGPQGGGGRGSDAAAGGEDASGGGVGGRGMGPVPISDGGVRSSDAGAGDDAAAPGGTLGGGAAPAASSGCGKSPTLTMKTQAASNGFGTGGKYTIQSGGQSRSFFIRLPDDYDKNRPYWLIFGFHWNGGLADDVDSGGTSKYEFSYYGLQKQSKNGAIFVAPQGIGNAWPNTGGRDLTFTDDMVKLITEDLCVDMTHIVSTGFSYGAGMSYAIACARAKVFDAVVLYEGMQLSGCEGGADPIAYMQLAGLADTTTAIGNARPMRDKFVRNNGCTAANPPEPPQGSLTHICTSYTGCSSGHPVRWCAHGSGHTPAPVDGSSSLVDGINTWTPKEVWSWLTSL